jgi:protein-S-isoprenylcysteine O-methyltransferase Ste14
MRGCLFAAPAVSVYVAAAPFAGGRLDTVLWGSMHLPWWLRAAGALFVAAGTALALWTLVLFAWLGDGTPNPIAPPRKSVRAGPYLYSRNPMMLGGWVAGVGLGLLIGSPAYLLLVGLFVLAGAVYVVALEERSLARRFGAPYDEYRRLTPRWMGWPRGR